jgi:hypothetical protein
MGDYANLINQYGGTAARGIGTVATAVGTYQAGKQQQQIARANADLARADATEVIAASGRDQVRLERQRRQVSGQQQVAIGANNVTQSGSALDALATTDAIYAEDAQTIRNNAARRAWGLNVEADLDSYAGTVARSTGTTRALTTLATGGIDTLDSYRQAKKRK